MPPAAPFSLLDRLPDNAAPLPHGLTLEQLQSFHRAMVTIRLYDERALKLQRSGRISFCVTSLGEEATQIGTAAALASTDWVFPSYRQYGVALWRGASVDMLAHQLFGNAADRVKGRQMPCHYSFSDLRFVSVSSVIGTQIIQAVGAAMAAQIQQSNDIAVTYFGDGATSANDFHSGMNLAGVRRAPVLFFCVNNQYAISLPASRQTASESFAAKGAAYGIPGVQVDGNDVLAVYAATKEAADRARRGEGPTLLELLTYRVAPHSSSDDPTRYRPSQEGETWRAQDPIVRLEAFLTQRYGLPPAQLHHVWEEVREAVQAATRKAEQQPLPDATTLFDDVYAKLPPPLARQRAEALLANQTACVRPADGEFPL